MYTVVIADDEAHLRESLIKGLAWEKIGFKVVGEAANGAEALNQVDIAMPDLLLTDIKMPFISGIEVARQSREMCPEMEIAFISGYDDFQFAREAIHYNVISYILKPVSLVEMENEMKLIKEKMDSSKERLITAASRYKDMPKPDVDCGAHWKKNSAVLVDQVMELIDSDFADINLCVGSVSAKLHISVSYLSALLKKEKNDTFVNLLTKRRMEAAKKALQTSQAKILEIALNCGFNDQHYFSYCFKKHYGVTPNKAREGM
ncbi:MAG: response regulator [Clostridiales bacterium]|nr:response regulator [Clostridiales bacterium]